MTLEEAIQNRHAVRAYTDKKIEGEVKDELEKLIEEVNKENDIHLQLVTDEPECFKASKPHYGNFVNCRNYIALVSKPDMDTALGYGGEQVVLKAQMLGLNTCWVVLTYDKAHYEVKEGEKLRGVIALGYGQSQGVAHKSKPIEKVVADTSNMPDWFRKGVEMALLAPTAMNQQKFRFTLKEGNKVLLEPTFSIVGNTKLDLGIVKYHFEVGAGKENFTWAEK